MPIVQENGNINKYYDIPEGMTGKHHRIMEDKSKMVRMYFDGGCSPNPGPMKACVVMIHADGTRETFYQDDLGPGTNNIAEWAALCWGMDMARSKGITKIKIIGDSMLVVKQAKGEWKIKNTGLKPFKREYDSLKGKFHYLELGWESRDDNLAGHHIEETAANSKDAALPEPVGIR
jgi:ribonuclease HI